MPETYTETPLLTERFDAALRYAVEHHRRQLRKGTTIPYPAHLLAVAALVLEMETSEDEAIGALLHDVVEDGGGPAALARIREEWGDPVADIVHANSDTAEQPKPPWRTRKEDYVASVATKAPDALRVSLADKLHNARSVLVDLREHGEVVWSRFSAPAGASDVVWYHRALLDAFADRADDLGPGARPALDELRRAVEDLEALAAA